MKHLTYEERIKIQFCLSEGRSITDIAKLLGKDRRTIVREIQNRRVKIRGVSPSNVCKHRYDCNIPDYCSIDCDKPRRCLYCEKCNFNCDMFEEDMCPTLLKAPYVCNACTHRCSLQQRVYNAKAAHTEYLNTLAESRSGICISDEDLEFLRTKVVPLIKQGLSVSTICEYYKDIMPICDKTLYSYINSGVLDINNLDLRLKVRRHYRKKSGPVLRVDKDCHRNRSYNDYLAYREDFPDINVCQMDSLIGRAGGKAILTLYFTNCGIQLYFIRDRNTAASVTQVFNGLRKTLGDDFTKLFQVILTDRGSEFTDPLKIEANPETGEIECKVFYCDPMNASQKAGCERNHEFFRYLAPKGKSFDSFTQSDMIRAGNHINSYPRKRWNWQAPVDVFKSIYGEEITKKLGLEKVPLININLREDLLK